MLYSHSHQDESFDYFASFLRNILRGVGEYKPLVVPVIDGAKSLAKNEKDFYHIPDKGFDVIVHLAQKDPNFFIHLDRDLSDHDYQHILDLVTAQRDVITA